MKILLGALFSALTLGAVVVVALARHLPRLVVNHPAGTERGELEELHLEIQDLRTMLLRERLERKDLWEATETYFPSIKHEVETAFRRIGRIEKDVDFLRFNSTADMFDPADPAQRTFLENQTVAEAQATPTDYGQGAGEAPTPRA